jgi:hypothetical protein
MSEYILSTVIGIVTGGGLQTLFSLRYARKKTKLDFADQAIRFMEEVNERQQKQYAELSAKHEALTAKVQELEAASCIKFTCKDRKRAV